MTVFDKFHDSDSTQTSTFWLRRAALIQDPALHCITYQGYVPRPVHLQEVSLWNQGCMRQATIRTCIGEHIEKSRDSRSGRSDIWDVVDRLSTIDLDVTANGVVARCTHTAKVLEFAVELYRSRRLRLQLKVKNIFVCLAGESTPAKATECTAGLRACFQTSKTVMEWHFCRTKVSYCERKCHAYIAERHREGEMVAVRILGRRGTFPSQPWRILTPKKVVMESSKTQSQSGVDEVSKASWIDMIGQITRLRFSQRGMAA